MQPMPVSRIKLLTTFDDDNVRNARLTLAVAVRHVLANGLDLLGVTAPEQM